MKTEKGNILKATYSIPLYYFDPTGIDFEKEDGVIVETARGTEFGKVVSSPHAVLDSLIVQPLKPIIRKATDLDKISEKTYREYLSEFSSKYSEGTTIRSNAYPELDGKTFQGQYILEIPASNAGLSNIENYKKIASEYDGILRFTEEIR